MDLIGISSSGDMLCTLVVVLFARTRVGAEEKAGDIALFGSGLAT